jgi:hypothetical protein
MMAAGKYKQERYDKAANVVDSAIGALDEIQAIPNSDDELRAKEYANRIRNIRDNYITRDLSDPFVQRELSNEINNKIDKEDIKHIQQTYQGYLGYNKQLAENESKGTPTPYWDRQKFEGYNSKQNGVFTGNASPQLDPYADTSQFMKQMAMTVKNTNLPIAPGVGAIEYSKSPEEILNHASKNIDAFMQQPSIQQYIRGIKNTGMDKGRTNKQIALDFVQENVRQWQEEKLDPYNIPEYGKNTYDPNVRIPVGREVLGREGEKANGAPMSFHEWKNKATELSNAAKSGNIDAKNKLLYLNKIDKEYKEKSTREQDSVRGTRLIDLYSKAEKIFKDKNKSATEAKKFINDFLSQSNIEKQVENEKWLYKKDIDKLVDTNLEFAFEDSLYKTLGETRGPVRTDWKEMKELREATKDLLKEQWTISKTNKELATERKNSILPTQETYTILNNDYTTNSSGIVSYQYVDQKGDPHSVPSALFSSLKDFMSQPNNYEKSVYKVNGKEVTKPKKVDSLLQNGNFTIDGIYSQPSGQGQPRAVLSVLNDEKIKIGEVEVKLPSDLLENSRNWYEELVSMGKPNLAFNLAYRAPITNRINNNDWEKHPIKTVAGVEGGDRLEVIYDKITSTFSINIIQKDGAVTNLEQGVEYDELPELATNEWYSNTD